MNLLNFCEHPANPALAQPLVFDGHVYASDGRIAVRIVSDRAFHNYTDAPLDWKWPRQICGWLTERLPKAKLSLLPLFDVPDLAECRECYGNRKVEDIDENENEIVIDPCPDCGGSGKTDKVPVKFNQVGISFYYLKKLQTLPGLKIDLTGNPTDMIPFVFDGGEGVVMPMRL
jgi:hypothetical protein